MKANPTIHEYTAPGTYHTTRGLSNQDSVLSAENRQFLAAALADGVGSAAKGGEGARIACRSIIDLLLAGGRYYMDLAGEKTAHYVIGQIRHELNKYADNASSIRDYASTAMFLLLDKESSKILCLNLGDGLILGVDREGCIVLSQPGLYRSGTCVTTTDGAEQLTSVLLLDAQQYRSVTLFSDGAWQLMYDRTKLRTPLQELLESGNFPALGAYMAQQNNYDDSSYIGLQFSSHTERRMQ